MLNRITLIGRLTHDPERRGNNPEKPIAYLRLAVDRDFKREGEPETDYFDVSAFGKQAEAILTYLKKGRLIDVAGSMHFREWEDSQTGEKKRGSEVILNEFHFLEKKDTAQPPAAAPAQAAPASAPQNAPAMPPFAPAGASPYGAAPAYPQNAPAMAGVPAAYGPGGLPTGDVPF